MSLSAKVSGHACFGGVFSYTVYRLDVNFRGDSWCIYRRYSDFAKLHELVEATLGIEKVLSAGITLPEKTIGFLSKGVLFNEMIIQRMEEFQRYLKALLEDEEARELNFVPKFFDCTRKGISGAVRELGPSNILCETIADVKPCKRLIEAWNTCFVALSKEGTIYVLRNIYDSPVTDPLVAYPISYGDVHVSSPAGSTVIDLKSNSTGLRVVLKLPTDALHANWLRTIADFTTRENSNKSSGGAVSGATRGQSFSERMMSRTMSSRRSSRTVSQAPAGTSDYKGEEIHLKAAGTGNTTDDLSSLYGI